VIKGYFDNSGDEPDRQHNMLTVGGFLANEAQWEKFEAAWRKNLENFGLPYLHMREFAHFLGPFHIFKKNESERIRFLKGCISAISDSGIKTSHCNCIDLGGLRKFNYDYDRDIDAFSFCLYVCHIDIQARFGNENHIDLMIDKFSKVNKKLILANEYGRTDTFYRNPAYNISTRSLLKDLSFENVLPIQAADFLVWESRKSQVKFTEWYRSRKAGLSPDEWLQDIRKWSISKWGKPINERNSLLALDAACQNVGIQITYETLVLGEKFHPNGWGDV
jgi:hypothetical protein